MTKKHKKKTITAAKVLELAKQCNYHNVEKVSADLFSTMEKFIDHDVDIEFRSVQETKSQQLLYLTLFYERTAWQTLRQVQLKFLLNYPETGSLVIESNRPEELKIAERLMYLLPTFKQGLYDLIVRLHRDLEVLEAERSGDGEKRDPSSMPRIANAVMEIDGEEPARKRQRIEQQLVHSSALFPVDILSKIFSFMPQSTWFSLAAVDKHFNHVLLYGTENIVYPIFYLFLTLPRLLQSKHHEELFSILDQIAVLKVDCFTIRQWKMNNMTHWNMTSLLQTANRHASSFLPHLGGIEKLMDIVPWKCRDAISCSSLPKIYLRGMEALCCFNRPPQNKYAYYKNRYAIDNRRTLGEECTRDRSDYRLSQTPLVFHFWPLMAALDHLLLDGDNINQSFGVYTTLSHYASQPKGTIDNTPEMIRVSLDLVYTAFHYELFETSSASSFLDDLFALAGAGYHTIKERMTKKIMRRRDHHELLKWSEFNSKLMMMQLMEIDSSIFQYAPPVFRNDRQIAELAFLGEVKTIPTNDYSGIPYQKFKASKYSWIDSLLDLRSDKQFMASVLGLHLYKLESLPVQLHGDKEFLQQVVIANPELLTKSEYFLDYVPDWLSDKHVFSKVLDSIEAKEIQFKKLDCKAWEKLTALFWQDRELYLKMLLLDEPAFEDRFIHHFGSHESPAEFYKKAIQRAPFLMIHCPIQVAGGEKCQDVTDLLSEEEQMTMLQNCLKFRVHLPFLPPSLVHKYKSTIISRVKENPGDYFPHLPRYATNDLDVCEAALKTQPTLINHVSHSILTDSMAMLQLAIRAPAITTTCSEPSICLFVADMLLIYLNEGLQFTELSFPPNMDLSSYFELPLEVRRDKRALKGLNAESRYTFTENAIYGKSRFKGKPLFLGGEEDYEKQEELEKLMRVFRKPCDVIWTNERSTEKDDQASGSSSDDE